MVVQVIHRGTPPQDVEYESTCLHCRSVLRFKRSDAQDCFDRNETFLSVGCPVCGHTVTKSI